MCVIVYMPKSNIDDVVAACDGRWYVTIADDGGGCVIGYNDVRYFFYPFTGDEELTYILLENEMLRRENEGISKLIEGNERLGKSLCIENDRMRGFRESYFNCESKLKKIPKFIRKIFGEL